VKIGYGTYGMPEESMEKALPRLAQIGYEGIELCIADPYPTAPFRLSPPARRSLRRLLDDSGLEPCALMMLRNVMADEHLHEQNLRDLGQACTLAHDIRMPSPAVITVTVGGRHKPWEGYRMVLVERLREWAAIAQREGCVVAAEPHVGAILERPERAAWVVAQVGSPALRLNFDISHFALRGYQVKYTTTLLAPLAVHAHVKDGRMVDGSVQFLLPGGGDFDYVSYLQWMQRAGYDGFITVEVSRQVSLCVDYDPYTAARFSYQTLARAFRRAGIAR